MVDNAVCNLPATSQFGKAASNMDKLSNPFVNV